MKVEDSRRLFEYDLRVLFQQKQFRDEGSQNYLVALLVLAELHEKNNVDDHYYIPKRCLENDKKNVRKWFIIETVYNGAKILQGCNTSVSLKGMSVFWWINSKQ